MKEINRGFGLHTALSVAITVLRGDTSLIGEETGNIAADRLEDELRTRRKCGRNAARKRKPIKNK